MHPDMLADDEFHARETDPRLWLHRYPECHFGGADIDHDRGTRLPELAHRRSRDVEGNRSLIDAANFTFGAGDRDICPGLELLCRVRCTHHGGNTQFPRHNGRMAGSAALVGDDAGRDLHDRLPIRTGGRRDQYLARLEGGEVARGRNAARAPGGDFFPDRATGDDDGPAPLQGVGLEDIGRTLRGHRLGPRLNDIKLAVGAILCPFDIHRHGNSRRPSNSAPRSALQFPQGSTPPHRKCRTSPSRRSARRECASYGYRRPCRKSCVFACRRAGGAAHSETLGCRVGL